MVSDLEKMKLVLMKHLKGSLPDKKIQDIATDLAKIDQGWVEVTDLDKVIGAAVSVQCGDICRIGDAYQKGVELRVFTKKKA